MNLQSVLDVPAPTIAYCALHQRLPEVPRDEYQKTMKELHQRIREETAAINGAFKQHVTGTIDKETENLRNTLSHFLHTPISSDNEDVRRILVESLERFKDQMLGTNPLGLVDSHELKIFGVSSKKAVEKRLLKNGRSYLNGLGFATTKGSPDIFESVFIVQGGLNLDVLEHIVRDRLGIYSTTHGKHIKEFGGYSYAVYNMVFSRGELPSSDKLMKFTELTFHFSKPDIKYAPFRNGLVETLEQLAGAMSIDHLSLWQRKLGLGAGKEFILRVVSDKSDRSSAVIEWFNKQKEKEFVSEALTMGGSLVVKEFLY
jgi:hypothetical protein